MATSHARGAAKVEDYSTSRDRLARSSGFSRRWSTLMQHGEPSLFLQYHRLHGTFGLIIGSCEGFERQRLLTDKTE